MSDPDEPLDPPRTFLPTRLSSLLRCIPLALLFILATPPSLTDPHAIDIVHPTYILTAHAPFLTHLIIPPAASLRLLLVLPANTTLRLDAWYTQPPPYSHPLLLASTRAPPPVYDSPTVAPSGLLGDFEAFWTRRRYAYIFVSNATRLYIRLYNNPLMSTYSPACNATIRALLVPPNSCPTGPRGVQCSGNGDCRAGECVCNQHFAGRYCEEKIRPLPREELQLPPEKMLYFRYPVPQNGSIALQMHILATMSSPGVLASQPVMIVKRPFENGGKELATGPPLPTLYDRLFADRAAFLGRLSVQSVTRANMKRGQYLYVGVYNIFKPVFYVRQHRRFPVSLLSNMHPVKVKLRAFPCSTKPGDKKPCPVGGQEPWELSLTFLLLPLLLGTLTLLTMVVCVSVWAGVFRQHLFDVLHGQAEEFPRSDKLSEAEVNAMFPAFVFTKKETDALGATGDVCCSVCLCSFEEGESLRRLACGHSYHSECLDKWLLTNATCPRCRKKARIHGDIGRGWLVRRHFASGVRRVVRWWNALRNWRWTEHEQQHSAEEDVEVGLMDGEEASSSASTAVS